jgi:predicted nucleic acid-binding protein
MVKPFIYLESSVVSYLANRPSRDMLVAARQSLTHEWWESLDKSQVYVSELVAVEVARGDSQAAARRLQFIEGLQRIDSHPAAFELSKRLMNAGVVPKEEAEDALHIAIATLHGFKFLATWNFSHFVGPEPKLRVMTTLQNWGYTPSLLITPEEYLEGGYNHE